MLLSQTKAAAYIAVLVPACDEYHTAELHDLGRRS